MLDNQRRADIKLHRFWARFISQQLRTLSDVLDNIPENNLYVTQKLVKTEWEKFMSTFRTEFYNYRFDSAALAYGQLSEQHRSYFTDIGEASPTTSFPPLFEDQIDEILEQVGKRRWEDGKNLVDRINNHDKAILGLLLVTAYLRNSQDKGSYSDALGYKTKSGAYYRLARLSHSELRAISSAASSHVNDYAPWTTKERINLSSSHPPINCVCEDIAGGIYEIGEISLPLHPNCGCYKTPVTITEKAFRKLWKEDSWPDMERYQHWLGVDRSALINTLLFAGADSVLQRWLTKSVEVA